MGCFKHLLLLAFFCQSLHGYTETSSCYSDADVLEQSDLTIVNILDQNGDWETIVSNQLDPKVHANNTIIDVKRQLVEKNARKKMVVTVSLKGNYKRFSWKPLRFYSAGAKNVIVNNDEKSVKKINEMTTEAFGGVLTNRPLEDNELFQVRIDKLINKYSTSLGIGITRQDPTTADYTSWKMCGTKILYNNQLYESGSVTTKNYGPNLRSLKVGDRVGVMKKSNGDLHFFVNGKDLGVATTGIKYRVHGVLDLYGNAIEASLIS